MVLLLVLALLPGVQPAQAQQVDTSHAALLAERGGFAANVTGGAGGGQYIVTTLADAGAGSLREAVSRPEALWIRFAVNGRIGLLSPLLVQANKTIDGRGARVEIGADRDVTGMFIGSPGLPVDNVIVTNLVFVGGPATRNVTTPEPNNDGITIQNGSNDIWIHRNTLTGWGDELVSLPWARNVRVSWNKLHDQADPATGAGLGRGLVAGNEASSANAPEIRLTVDHNYFTNVPDRSPRAGHGAWAHVYNNFVEGWHYHGMSGIRGIDKFGPSVAAQVYSQNNIFQPRFVAATGKTDTSAMKAIVTEIPSNKGLVRNAGNLLLNGATQEQNAPASVFTPSYPYTVETADSTLRDKLVSGAGWRDLPAPDTTAPTVSITQPAANETVSGVVAVSARSRPTPQRSRLARRRRDRASLSRTCVSPRAPAARRP